MNDKHVHIPKYKLVHLFQNSHNKLDKDYLIFNLLMIKLILINSIYTFIIIVILINEFDQEYLQN